MKTITGQAALVLTTGTPALAAGGAGVDGYGLLAILFLSFGALIIVFQLIPAFMLFRSMIKELFGRPAKAATLNDGKTARTH